MENAQEPIEPSTDSARGLTITWCGPAVILALLIVVFGVLGVLAMPFHRQGLMRWFDLDDEITFPAAFSAGLLALGGALAAGLPCTERQGRVLTRVLGAVFLFMACDEACRIHETLEGLTHIDWQVLYLPLMPLAGCGWLSVLLRTRGTSRWLWVLGAGAWVGSQMLEAGQWGWWTSVQTKCAHYSMLMVGEELGEMCGSACFVLALFCMTWPDGLRIPWRRTTP